MSLLNRFSAALLCSALVWITGCVGPMACGPTGQHGPIALGTSCDGCGECEGCGELYIDPWINHPAEHCDPCDQCGNYNGQSCGKCRSLFDGIASLWGYRCQQSCGDCGSGGCDGGCGSPLMNGGFCGEACPGCDFCDASAGGVVEIVTEPTPAKRIVEAVPAEVPYTPHRTRKIFKARPNIASGPEEYSDY